jgi:hypothetical protein
MGNCLCSSATLPSNSPPPPVLAPTQETAPFTHPATSTPSPYVAVSSKPIDYRDNPPPSSYPHRCEMRLHPYRFRGRVSPQLHKSILSTDTTFLQRPRSHSSSRMTRTSPTILFGCGPRPTGTQFESGLASGTGRMPPDSDRREHRPCFPSTLQSVLSNDFRYVVRCRGVGHNI